MSDGKYTSDNVPKCPLHAEYKSLICPKKLQRDFIRPDQPSKCEWVKNKNEQHKSPHSQRSLHERPKIIENILDAIGMTPMVKLNHIPQSLGIKCQMYAKCEFLNPGGSVKDRIGYRMIQDAEDKGLLIPGVSTIIEPTSGNTGIGLAMACAVHGYRCVIVLPEKNSDEKVNTLKALGAEIIRTRTEARFDEPDSLVAVAQRLQHEIPNSVILNQYTNCGNPLAHYDGTGAEILYQLDGKVDMVVMGAGTGGTITGVGRKIKEECPDCIIVGVDPEGSILARPKDLNETDVTGYEIEGIGYDFIPTVLDHSVVDRWVKINDQKALPMARRLICEEGLLCGGSSGAAMWAALNEAKDLNEDQKCVILCPDNIRNYLTKFVVDNWLEARNLKESINIYCHPWWNNSLTCLIPSELPLTFLSQVPCQQVIEKLKEEHLEQAPVVDGKGNILGMATVSYLITKLLNTSLKPTDAIEKGLFKKFVKIGIHATVGRVSRILEKEPYAVVVQKGEIRSATTLEIKKRENVVAVITQKEMLNFISKPKPIEKDQNGQC